MAAAQEQIPPLENIFCISEETRLRLLPPLEYELMNADHRLAFIQWYQRTPEGRKRLETYPSEDILASYPKDDPSDTLLKECLVESFESYMQQKWNYGDKQPPQPDSYFLFHRKFSRSPGSEISLTSKMNLVMELLFSPKEMDQIKTQKLETVTTAISSKGLHYHEIGKLTYRSYLNKWIINISYTAVHFKSATSEFLKLNTTEVWFRRAKNGIPQFIFCHCVSKELPLLPLPLSTPGQPETVLALGRLQTLPALLPEMFRPEHKNDFYQWLLANDKFHINDEDPESLKLAPLLFHFCSNDFHLADPKIFDNEVALVYQEYIQERWSMPSKQPPLLQSVYLFGNVSYSEYPTWICFAQELIQEAKLLILNKVELQKFDISKSLHVMLCIYTSNKVEIPGVLVSEEKVCKICFTEGQDFDVREMRTMSCIECWFIRSQFMPVLIIKQAETV